jgi:hypothetical protein
MQNEKKSNFSIPDSDPNQLRITPNTDSERPKSWPGTRLFRVADAGTALPVTLVPFADAGQTGADYQIWLPFGRREKAP